LSAVLYLRGPIANVKQATVAIDVQRMVLAQQCLQLARGFPIMCGDGWQVGAKGRDSVIAI
jgi:hypothetical protein